jgi:hypothetical protein
MQVIPNVSTKAYAVAADVTGDGSKTLVSDNALAYLWAGGVFTKVGTTTAGATAITPDGTVVLTSDGATTVNGTTQALAARLAANGYDLGDFVILFATDISGNGKVILGTGYHNVPGTTYDGFMVTFP